MPTRSIVVSLSLLVLGCARPVTEPPAVASPATASPAAASPAAIPPATAPLVTSTIPWPDAATCTTAARTPPGSPSVDADLRTIVGGHYSPDHLGLEPFAAIEDHVQREPDAFLDAWGRIALDPSMHVDLHWNNVLTRTAAARPERVRELAACMLTRFDAALAHPPADRDPAWEDRVEGFRYELYLSWRGREHDGSWRLALPSRACTTTTEDATTVTIEADCTCGEPIGCDLAIGPHRTDILVTLDTTALAMCRDCYPGTGTCTLPDPTLPLTLNGLAMPIAPCSR
jgi:hypothetical protein